MFTWLILGLIVGAAAATVAARAAKSRALPGAAQRPLLAAAPTEPDLASVAVGDIIVEQGRDFLVEGVLIYDEAGFSWRQARLFDDSATHWLVVGIEAAEPGTVWWVSPEPALDLGEHPPVEVLLAGRHYRQTRRGTASVQRRGELGEDFPRTRGSQTAGTIERCRFWCYADGPQDVLLIESWSDRQRILRGTVLRRADVELWPGART